MRVIDFKIPSRSAAEVSGSLSNFQLKPTGVVAQQTFARVIRSSTQERYREIISATQAPKDVRPRA